MILKATKESNGDQKIFITIWVSPYEDPSKGKDILLNKRHQWIAVKVVRYAKFFKIGKLIWCWSIFLCHIFSIEQDKTKFLKRTAGQANFHSPEIWSAYPLSWMWTEKDSWHAFAIKALIFLDFPWMRLRISKGKKQCYAFCGVWVLWWLSFVFKAPVPYNFREAGFNTMFWRLTWKACQIMLWMVKLTYRRMHDYVQSIFANWFMSCGSKIPNLTFTESNFLGTKQGILMLGFVNVSTRMLSGEVRGHI